MNELSKHYNTYDKQVILLNMMKDIDVFLKERGIKYSLCGGSLLGAVREKGFIPWDDDIDIMVDRKNYQKLIDSFSNDKGQCGYMLNRYLWIDRIQRKEDVSGDLHNPTIDVFVMDNCPDNTVARRIKVILVMALQGMMKKDIEYRDKSILYKMCLGFTHTIGKPFSDERKYRWYQTVAKIGDNKKTKFITGYTDLFKLLTLRYPGNLLDAITYQQFEDYMLPITAEYDSYLTTQYGDYMTPPQEKERVPHYT